MFRRCTCPVLWLCHRWKESSQRLNPDIQSIFIRVDRSDRKFRRKICSSDNRVRETKAQFCTTAALMWWVLIRWTAESTVSSVRLRPSASPLSVRGHPCFHCSLLLYSGLHVKWVTWNYCHWLHLYPPPPLYRPLSLSYVARTDTRLVLPSRAHAPSELQIVESALKHDAVQERSAKECGGLQGDGNQPVAKMRWHILGFFFFNASLSQPPFLSLYLDQGDS